MDSSMSSTRTYWNNFINKGSNYLEGKKKRKTRRKAAHNAVWLSPLDIKFTQATIYDTFTNSSRVADTIAELKAGLDPDRIPAIRVRKHNGVWYSLDNRRLYCFREAGTLMIRCHDVTYTQSHLELLYKRTTTYSGERVKVVSR
ncbi:hypothetical protein DFJ77DRAFT_460499 [Powellomyces hirtus]|nr:hypothetical protein DFJ77DRAFT_460499 [Powellomyces hirtus]